MGYPEKLQRLCALRGLDQSTLAAKVGLSRSSMSRILSGAQEPKLGVARALATALGVSLDYLMEEGAEEGAETRWELVSEDEAAVLRIVRKLGVEAALDRLLGVPEPAPSERPGPSKSHAR